METLADGIYHAVPADIQEAIEGQAELVAIWNKLTPIQRNEWICWVTHVKRPQTRRKHVHRLVEELAAGKRQPCCWPGCPHRRPKAQKWFKSAKK